MQPDRQIRRFGCVQGGGAMWHSLATQDQDPSVVLCTDLSSAVSVLKTAGSDEWQLPAGLSEHQA